MQGEKTSKGLIMNKNKVLIILIAFVAFLTIITLLFRYHFESSDSEDNSELKNFIGMIDFQNIEKVIVRDGQELAFEMTYELDHLNEGRWALSSDRDVFFLEQMTQEQMSLYISLIESTYSERILHNVDDMSIYGLDRPTISISFYQNDGQIINVFVGEKTSDGNHFFVCTDQNNDVALIPVDMYSFLKEFELFFVDKNMMQLSYWDITHLEMYRAFDDFGAEIYSSANAMDASDNLSDWQFVSPIHWPAGDQFNRIILQLFYLSVTRYYRVDDSEVYGFDRDNSDYLFVFHDSHGEKQRIYLTDTRGDRFIGFSDAHNLFFSIDQSRISGLQTPIVNLLNSQIIPFTIYQTNRIECYFPEGDFYMNIDIEEGQLISSDDAFVYLNGQYAKVRSSDNQYYFDLLFRSIVGISIDSIEVDNTLSLDELDQINPDIRILFNIDGRRTIEYSFFERNHNSLYLFIDGEYSGLTVSRESLYGYDIGFFPDLGVWGAYRLLEEALDAQVAGIYDIY